MVVLDLLGGESYVINNFNLHAAQTGKNGFDGIKLSNSTGLTPGVTKNPLANGGAVPANSSTTATGAEQLITFYASAAQSVAQTIVATITGFASGFWDTGSTQIPVSGPVTLTIPAGQDSVTVGLIDTSTSQQAQTAQISETLSSDGAVSNTLSVTFAGASAPLIPTSTINGVLDPTSGVTTFSGDGQNDIITGTSGLNNITGSSGSDSINGGASNDTITSGNGNSTVSGGGGGQDLITLGNGNNQIYAGSVVTVSQALTQQQSGTGVSGQGDYISAGDGNNTIVGSNAGDYIVVGSGADLIICGDGATTVSGGIEVTSVTSGWNNVSGPGTIDGYYNGFTTNGAQEYTSPYTAPANYNGCELNGVPYGLGNDTIFGGKGNSTYYLPNGNNYVDAGGGNDIIFLGAGDNTIFGGAGNDSIQGSIGNNYIDGETGNDLIFGEGGNSTIFGGTGNDTIYSGSYTNWATEITTNNSDIEVGNGNTIVYGAGGNDTMQAGEGNDTLNAGAGNESLLGGDGNVTMLGGAGNDTLTGGEGNAYLGAGTGNTTITGGDGTDTIFGGSGTNVITAGDGGTDAAPVQVVAGSGDTTITGGDGVTAIWGGAGNDVLNAGDGGDAGQASQIIAGTGETTINGGDGIDHIVAGAGNDSIIAGDGGTADNATTIAGGSGNDTMVAGAGYDNFYGGSDGSSTYQINSDAGVVNIYNSQPGDTLQFGDGITVADISSITQTSYNNGSAYTITTDDGGTVTIYGGPLDQASFADGSTVSFSQLLSSQFVIGNVTYSAVDAALPTGGSSSEAGSMVTGGLAAIQAQEVSGTTPQSLVLYGTADIEGVGNNVNDIITANSGDDTLIAGSANNTLIGGGGSEDYAVTAGTGTTTTIVNSTEADTLYFAPGIALTDLTASTSTAADGSLIVTLQNDQGGQVVIDGSLNSTVNGGDGSSTMLDQIVFADGTSASLSQIVGQLTAGATTASSATNVTLAGGIQNLTLTAANTTAMGNDLNDVITAGATNDTLIAGSASDTMVGGSGSTTYNFTSGSGDATITNSSASDTLVFGSGITESDLTTTSTVVNGQTVVTITSSLGGMITIDGGGLNQFSFADGNVASLAQLLASSYNNGNTTYSNISTTAAAGITVLDMTGNADVSATANSGNDILMSNVGNDTLNAGTGSDTLVGGGVSDVYSIANGSQTTTIEQSSMFDTLAFGTGVSLSDLSASETVVNGADVITLTNSLGGTVVVDVGAGAPVDSILFEDGSTGSLGEILAQATAGASAATSATDVTLPEGIQNMLLTGSANVTATGNELADVIQANSGNDTLVAGLGNDTLLGGAGNTTYEYDAEDANVVIKNSGNGDTLVIDDSLGESDITASSTVVGGHTVVTLTTDEGTTITIDGGGLNQVSFADGNVATISELLASSYTNGATTYSNVSTTAGSGITTLAMTGSANVTATANASSDTLIANSGNDTLVAGAGSDTLVGGGDATTYSFAQTYGAATIENAANTDIIAMGAGVTASNISLAQSQNADGSISLIIGNNLGNSITIADYSPGDADTLTFTNGQSLSIQAVLAQGTSGFSAATSVVNVTLPEGIQNMTLTGTSDLLAIGNDEDDVITSNSGDDTLVAGSANDTLVGGAGATTYAISAGDGNVVINNSSGNDTLAFDSSISEADLSATSATVNGQTITTIANSQGGTITLNGGGLTQLSFADGNITLAQLLSDSFSLGETSYSAVSTTAGDGITTLIMTGSANVTATANTLNDTLVANSGNDSLVAGTGNDTLVGSAGATTYEIGAGDGNVVIDSSSANDTLSFDSSISDADLSATSADVDGQTVTTITNSQGGTITINGGGLNAVQFANGATATLATLGEADTTFYASQGVVNLPSWDTTLVLTGSANIEGSANDGNNTLVSNSGNDTLIAGGGNDTFVGGTGNTTYALEPAGVAYGAATIEDAGTGDAIAFPSGVVPSDISFTVISEADGSRNLQINNSQGNSVTIENYMPGMADALDFVEVGTESIQYVLSQMTTGLYAATSDASLTLSPDVLNMTLTGTGNLVADANNEDNVIASNAGNDTLVAGTGSDTFVGGNGVTTYEINAGDGNVVIKNCNANDILQFGAGITAGDLTVSATSGEEDFVTIDDDQGGSITINYPYATGGPYLNQIDFANGTSTTLTQLFAALAGSTQTISNDSDPVSPSAVNIIYTASNGGVDGNELNDTITIEGSNDEARAGAGFDTLIAGTGASGSYFYTDLDPNTPTTFVIDANTGTTTISIKQGDTLDFGPGITAANVSIAISGSDSNDWTWTVTTAQGATVILNLDPNSDLTNSVVNFADGTATTLGQLLPAPIVSGSTMTAQGNATLTAGLTNLVFTGNGDVVGVNNNDNGTVTTNEGNDTLTAAGANDTIYGGSGNETLTANGDNDIFEDQSNFGSSNSTLTLGGNNDFLILNEGKQSATLSGANDTVYFYNRYDYYPNPNDPTLLALQEDNNSTTIVGGGGNDTYSFGGDYLLQSAVGEIDATLENTSSSDTLSLPVNLTQFTTSSAIVNGVTVTTFAWDGGSVSVSGGLQQLTSTAGVYTFSDLLSMATPVISSTGGTLAAGVTLYGLEGAGLTATANNLNDYIAIDTFNHNLEATYGDTLVSGTGNDTLDGSGGSTAVYEIAANSGTTTILPPNASSATLQFEGNVTASSLSASQITAADGSVIVTIQVAGGNPVILYDPVYMDIDFADGSQTSLDVLLTQITSSTSIVMPDGTISLVLTGSDNISGTGNSSDDTITANSGNDTLIAGSGLATLIGGSGNDTFVVNSADDVITEAVNTGNNTEQTSFSTTLVANVQNLTGIGGTAIKLTGNSLNNVITANNANDTLVAGSGNATLVSGTGNDSMTGGAGNDTFVVNYTGDKITVSSAKAGNVVQSAVTYVLPTNLLNLTGIGSNAISLTGNASVDTITANSGNDTLTAGSGLATLIGGSGNDTFIIDNTGDVITEAANTGNNLEQTSVTITLAANVQNLTGTGSTSISLKGNSLANVITANSGNDTLQGGTGASTLVGGTGNDTMTGSTAATIYQVNSTDGNTVINSSGANDVLSFGSGITASTVTASSTGTGSSTVVTLTLSTGKTVVLNNPSLTTVDFSGASASTLAALLAASTSISSSVSITMPAGATTLTLTGTGNISGTGNTLADTIIANSGNDTLIAGSGNDTLISGTGNDSMTGGAGNDTFVVNNSNDKITVTTAKAGNITQSAVSYVLPTSLLNLTGTGSNNISLTGNASADTITANSGNDTLTAGSGLATLIGGSGNDTFIVNSASDVITVSTANAANIVQSSVSDTLGANLLTLTGTSTGAINLTGNTLADTITANSGNDTLTSGTGIDTLIGGAGNDTFVINNSSDAITVTTAKAGNVTQSSVSYVLPANLLSLTGTSTGAINLTGNTLADTITANSGNDTLTSGTGIDTLVAGTGNDTFIINNSSDAITVTTAKAGNVTQSSVNYVLPANLLNLTGTGTNAISLTGNASADTITANSGNDTLTAGSGLATLIGGAGNDLFIVNSASDVITEAANTGNNTEQTSVTVTLATNVQNLTGSGSTAIKLTGNTLNNVITGNSGNDTLVAGAGNDTLTAGTGSTTTTFTGGAGNDVFNVNSTTDVITAVSGTNVNTINSSVSYTAPTNVQDLFLTGTGSLTATANSGNDMLIGNSGTDTLTGGTGVDVLEAGSGADTLKDTGGANALIGGAGNDTITGGTGTSFIVGGAGNDAITLGAGTAVVAFNTGAGKATIAPGTGVSNVLSLGGGIDYANLAFSKSGNNLILSTGGNNTITFTNWYVGSTDQNFVTLQVIEQAASTYSSTSSNTLYSSEVEEFSFTQLVAAFNAALAATPSLTSWSLSNSLLTDHLSSSNTVALGGDLAYYDGLNGNLTGLNLATAVTTLQSSTYGKTAQTIDAWSGISNGTNKLH